MIGLISVFFVFIHLKQKHLKIVLYIYPKKHQSVFISEAALLFHELNIFSNVQPTLVFQALGDVFSFVTIFLLLVLFSSVFFEDVL